MAIKIKDSKKGSFTKAAKSRGKSVKQFEQQVLANKDEYSPAMVKKANFSRNARGWNKGQQGISVPNNFQQADAEIFNNFKKFPQEKAERRSSPYMGTPFEDLPDSIIMGALERESSLGPQVPGYSDKFRYPKVEMQPHVKPTPPPPPQPKTNSYRGEYGQAALAGLLAVDAFIPNKDNPYPISQPGMGYNPSPYGKGDLSIAQNGVAMGPKFKRPITYQEQQDSVTSLNDNLQANPNTATQNSSSYLNPQQEFFYRALTSPSDNISDVYKGFNEELVGQNASTSRGVNPSQSPYLGTTLLSNEDRTLLQDEYINYSQKYKKDSGRYLKNLQSRGATDQRLNNLIPAASMALGQPYKNGGKVSNSGYKFNSPDFNEPNLTIPSNQITMQGVPFPVVGTDNTGMTQTMYPGGEYQFPGEYVQETPIRRMGGKMKKCKSGGKLSNYEIGQSYDLSDAEIKELTSQGWEIQIL